MNPCKSCAQEKIQEERVIEYPSDAYLMRGRAPGFASPDSSYKQHTLVTVC